MIREKWEKVGSKLVQYPHQYQFTPNEFLIAEAVLPPDRLDEVWLYHKYHSNLDKFSENWWKKKGEKERGRIPFDQPAFPTRWPTLPLFGTVVFSRNGCSSQDYWW